MARADEFASEDGGAVMPLPPRMDITTVRETAAALRERAGEALVLDAGGVTHLGGIGLELLLAAAHSWRDAGLGFAITPRSAAFDAALRDLGAPSFETSCGRTR